MRLLQVAEALGVSVTVFFEEGKRSAKVSDMTLPYTPGGGVGENLRPLNKEEMTLLKLFRKTKNRKVREGIIKQLRGTVELENPRKKPPADKTSGKAGTDSGKRH